MADAMIKPLFLIIECKTTICFFSIEQKKDLAMPSRPFALISNSPLPSGAVCL